MSTPIPSPQTASDIARIKLATRPLEALDDWLSNNIHLFGMVPPKDPNNFVLSTSYEFDELFDIVTPGEVLRVALSMEVGGDPQHDTFADNMLGIADVKSFYQSQDFSMHLPLAEWPCMVGYLTAQYLNRNGKAHFAWQNEGSRILLDKFIPLHFPGTTRMSLEAMHSAGLLPQDYTGDVMVADLLTLLYQKRGPEMAVALPTDMTL